MSRKADIDSAIAGLVRRGLSVRAIAEELGRAGVKLGKSAVADRVAKARQRAAEAPPPARPLGEKATPPPARAPRAREADELVAEVASADVLDLAGLRALDGRLAKALEVQVEPKTLVALTDCRVRLAQAMARLIPPPVPDPQSDPANVEAAALLVKLLEGMVADAERRTVGS